MEAINSAQLFEDNVGNYEAWEEEFITLVEKETVERYVNNYYEPSYPFRGVIIGLLLCLPFWAILFLVVT
jgi:hypothetical protein